MSDLLVVVGFFLVVFVVALLVNRAVKKDDYFNSIEESHVEEDNQKIDVPKYNILTEMVKTVHRESLRGKISIGKKSSAIDFNPFNRSDERLIMEATLGIPPWTEQKLEELLKRVLKTNYSKYYEKAKWIAALKYISKTEGIRRV